MDGQVTMIVPGTPAKKKIAIVGTAPTWRQTPWQDKDLTIACLNDAYMLNVPRADVWFDLHPFDKFFYRPRSQKVINALDLPIGHYVRPEGHIEWLAQQKLPVYVQKPISPNMIRFPIEEVKAWLEPYLPTIIDDDSDKKPYIMSTPAMMLIWAHLQGFREVYVFGIHLATQWEYQRQRPNFEALIFLLSGLGTKTFLPKGAPICHGDSLYAYEPKPDLDVEAVQRQIQQAKMQQAALQKKQKTLKWWQRDDSIVRQLKLLAAHVTDKEIQVQRLVLAKRAA